MRFSEIFKAIVAVVDSERNPLVEYNYDPWGKITCTYLGEGADQTTLQMFTAILCPLTYRGYNYDFSTGLYYLQSRYYNPEWGRFLNCDDTSILLATQGETLGANMFAYCNNDPINRVDYTGMENDRWDTFVTVYSIFAWAGVQELVNFGCEDLFEEPVDGFAVDFDQYGLYHLKFAFKGKRGYFEKYKLCLLVVGDIAPWTKFAFSYQRLTKNSKNSIYQATERTAETIYKLPNMFKEGTRERQIRTWINTTVGVAVNIGALYHSIAGKEYEHPYVSFVEQYRNCEGISVLYKVSYNNWIGESNFLRLPQSIPDKDHIYKKRGVYG